MIKQTNWGLHHALPNFVEQNMIHSEWALVWIAQASRDDAEKSYFVVGLIIFSVSRCLSLMIRIVFLSSLISRFLLMFSPFLQLLVLHHPSHSYVITPASHSSNSPKTSGVTEERCLKHMHILSVEMRHQHTHAYRAKHVAKHLLCHITPWAGLRGGFSAVRSPVVGRI